MWRLLQGDLGMSLEFGQPVTKVIGERLLLTVILALTTALFAWALAVPIGIYSAVRQHSPEDYLFTFIGFLVLIYDKKYFFPSIVFLTFKNYGKNIYF